MIAKKTVVEGVELSQALSPLQFLHDLFGTSPVEAKTISRFTSEHRDYKKKIISEGRSTRWGAIQPIREKIRK